MSINNLTAAQLRRAANIKDRIAVLEANLSRLLGEERQAVGPVRTQRKPRRMSAAGRKSISEAQKARWAKLKAKQKSATAKAK